jgi:hypothetical protein
MYILKNTTISTTKSRLSIKKTTIYSSDFNTTSFNWWMETAALGGQAKPETDNATSFNWWLFTSSL